MPYYAVHYTYAEDPRLEEIRPLHREFLGSLARDGFLRASGPYVGTTPPSALLVFRAESEASVRELLSHDPFQLHRLVTDVAVTEWNPVIGVFAD